MCAHSTDNVLPCYVTLVWRKLAFTNCSNRKVTPVPLQVTSIAVLGYKLCCVFAVISRM